MINSALSLKKIILFVLLVLLLMLVAVAIVFYQKTQENYWFERRAIQKFMIDGSGKNNTNFDYKIVLVGDSMTEYLGNAEGLEYFLNQLYPQKNFLLLNYGFSSTNMLTLPDRISKDSTHSGRIFEPINNIDYDLILIESMGHNPMSELPLQAGLAKQNEILDQTINLLSQKHDNSKIVFVATISPNRDTYAKPVDLSLEKRHEWANERIAYIKNFIKYANDHQIKLINIYQQSLDSNNNGREIYINPTDEIHPSVVGVTFIQDQIAKFIKDNNLLKT